ncbi:MAG TPA: glycerol-3-phosphate acyltransferase, partial [Ignavibacteria bacterium]|nr:glycerol-3-phosphate acyltransferase [Ignavibacteria bacterium]
EGSGNVGTLNAIQVTSSKTIGIIVLLIDILKGLIPVYFLLFVFHIDYSIVMPGTSCIVLGHNYPVWLGLKGGRGLATGTGIFILLNYFVLLGWCIAWLIVYGIKRNVLISNVIATILIPLYIFIISKVNLFIVDWDLSTFSFFYFSFFSILTTVIIISKHLEIFRKN